MGGEPEPSDSGLSAGSGGAGSDCSEPTTTQSESELEEGEGEVEVHAEPQALAGFPELPNATHHSTSSFPGEEAGYVPNLFLNAVAVSELRRHPRYQALPPVELVDASQQDWSCFVRQDSDTWELLHAGVLTTGVLMDALGLRERAAGKRLGLSKQELSHSRLMSAYQHLLGGAESDAAAQVGVRPEGAATASATTNLQTTLAYNARLPHADGEAAARGGGAGGATAHAEAPRDGAAASPPLAQEGGGARGGGKKDGGGSKKRQRKGKGRPASAAARGRGKGVAGGGSWGRVDLGALQDAAAQRAAANALAVQGISAVRCAWGNTQEASSLHTLLRAFSWSEMKELGLCMVDVSALPAEWGLTAADLPPIGASPDEVVEVKNLCPYEQRASGPKRGGRPMYCLAERRAPQRVPAKYLPQVQLEMLATRTASALVALDTAHHGMSVFRIARDDEYLRQMLHIISKFYKCYVQRRRAPPEDMFIGDQTYRAFIQHTLRLRDKVVWLGNTECDAGLDGLDATLRSSSSADAFL